MAVIKMKPTSPGRRGMVKVTRDHLHKGEGYAPLLEPQFQKAGRNNNGHITTRHKGGGHKHHYRVVDFRRNKDNIPAKVERIEYDPNRTAHIALLCYADGERRYIIAPRGVEVGATLLSGSESPIRVGNTLPIRNIPVGSTIHCIELQVGKGAQIARSAGASAVGSAFGLQAAMASIAAADMQNSPLTLPKDDQRVDFVPYARLLCSAIRVAGPGLATETAATRV